MSDSDYSLALKLKESNKHAFDRLFFKYYNPLVRYAFNICKNKSLAEDSVQQIFIKIWKDNSLITNNETIGKLLFTYTYNQLIDEIRKENTRKKYEGLFSENTNQSSNEEFNENKFRAKAIIESAIDKLPEKTKEVFRLAKQEGLSYDEIADYLKISQKTVENQLGSAYKKLREYLSPYKDLL